MRTLRLSAIATSIAFTALSASAQELDQQSRWYVQPGQGEESSYALVVGATLPWKNWSWRLGSGSVHGHWDMWIGGLSNKDLRNVRFTTSVLGIGPSVRWRAANGTSPWFVEAGTAIMATGKRLYNDNQRMGTRFNFATHLGFGVNFGAQHAHELSLRVQHESNAGIKSPNPGLNFVQMRYAYAF